MSVKDKINQLCTNHLKALINNNSSILINAFYHNRTSLLITPVQSDKLPSIPSTKFNSYGRLIRGHKGEGLPVLTVELGKTIDQLKVTLELPNDVNLMGPMLGEDKPLTVSVHFSVTTDKNENGERFLRITEPLESDLLHGASLIEMGIYMGQSTDERITSLKPLQMLDAIFEPLNFINQLSTDMFYNNFYFRNLTINN